MKPLALAFSTYHTTGSAMNISVLNGSTISVAKLSHMIEKIDLCISSLCITKVKCCGKKRRYAYSIRFRPDKELNYSTQIPGTATFLQICGDMTALAGYFDSLV
jgi:hypothetical protein